MSRMLIVNADDGNLTQGVTEAILDCHDHGIVTSASWLVNLPWEDRTVRSIRRRSRLGVGLHLNVTLGLPVSKPQKVRSLTDRQGSFRRKEQQLSRLPKEAELALEYESQINHFRKIFNRYPTHLDTHHQVHDHPFFFRVISHVAHRYQLPIRRSQAMLPRTHRKMRPGASPLRKLKTTDYLFGSLNPSDFWRQDTLESILWNLPEGMSEIMCHPGRDDRDLRSISSLTKGRASEFRLFRSASLRKRLKKHAILLSHYGLWYTKKR